MTRTSASLFILVLAALPVCAQQLSEEALESHPLPRLVDAVAVEQVADAHLRFLASDALTGRDTATPGGAVTAEYVASVFRSLDLQPAGDDGGFLQRYPLVAATLDPESLRLQLFVDGERVATLPRTDYAPRGYGITGFEVEAGAVFVGHGIVDEKSGVDDYDGLDVQGKLVLAISGGPEGRGDLRRASYWRSKQRTAQARGAAGLILITPEGSERAQQMFGYARAQMAGRSMSLPSSEPPPPAFPRLYLQEAAAQAIFEAAGQDFRAAEAARRAVAGAGGFELPGVELSLAVSVTVEELQGSNVVAVLPGRDPQLRDEYLVLSAHMDHVGVGSDGSIYNGADDNASGTTTVLTVAAVLTANPAPRRSIVFLTVSGEEKGLLGSRWFVANPTVDLDAIVGNVNMDMVGRNDPFSLGITPSPEHAHYNSMVDRAVDLGPAAGLDVSWMAGLGDYERRVDDYYSRSDHKNFTDAGIPAVFFFAGEHEDYHRPSDTVDKIDRGKLARVVDLVSRVLVDLGNTTERPTWNGR